MENDSISSSSSESKLPLIVGIVGFALGAAGLVLALKAKSAADKASADAATTSASVSELSGQISSKANASDVAALSSVKALQDLNPGINPNNLKVGSKIKTK
jgi:xanthosine utilization system XapX-like protein